MYVCSSPCYLILALAVILVAAEKALSIFRTSVNLIKVVVVFNMVNIPPIPPLLCSTPPPIDFGDDEDVNALPLSLDGVVDDCFGVFRIEDDITNNVPLPSPRPPSACDLPKISIYDNLVSYDKEHLTSHLGPLPASNDQVNNDSRDSRKENISEAFNFNLRNTNSVIRPDQSRNLPLETEAEKVKVAESLDIANQILKQDSNGCSAFSQSCAPGLCKNFKELKINSLNSAPDISLGQNVVSIEDIEDDLSDDELYSPKIPKNFLQTDDMSDFFKIEEINTLNVIENKINLDYKNVDAKSLNSLDISESASFGNEHIDELSSFSSSSLIQNQLDTPPPVQQIGNSINDDDDDDFGEFADFQKMQFLNNIVPANDNDIKENVDLEVNDFNDFTKYNTTEDYVDNNATQYINNSNDSEDQDCLKVSTHTDGSIDDITANSSKVSNMFEMKQETCKQEASNEIVSAVNKNNQPLKEFFNKGNISNEFSKQSAINDTNNWPNFSEFSNTAADNRNTSETVENVEQVAESSICNLEDEFDDFADFKSQEINEPNIKSSSYNEDKDNTVEHDDDDFGEFNTAEPVTIASNTTFTKTSPNSNAGNPGLPFNNINERILKILKLMFPSIVHPEDNLCAEAKTNKIQDIPFTSIDTAKALEYQWMSSETRHSFIKSLSIDSKNILFGDNWNPSLPRFAANLSFNPLKPMKPLQSSGSTLDVGSVLEPVPSSRSEMNNAQHISVTAKKELDLDWKSMTTIDQTINDKLNQWKSRRNRQDMEAKLVDVTPKEKKVEESVHKGIRSNDEDLVLLKTATTEYKDNYMLKFDKADVNRNAPLKGKIQYMKPYYDCKMKFLKRPMQPANSITHSDYLWQPEIHPVTPERPHIPVAVVNTKIALDRNKAGYSKYLDPSATTASLDYCYRSPQDILKGIAAKDNITFWNWKDIKFRSRNLFRLDNAQLCDKPLSKECIKSRSENPSKLKAVPNSGLTTEVRENYVKPNQRALNFNDCHFKSDLPFLSSVPEMGRTEYSVLGSGECTQKYV